MNTDIISYYKQRANEYETVYHKPERQHDLIQASKILQEIFVDKNVLEIACGIGYWTEVIAKTAHSILANDINETVLYIAKTKYYSLQRVISNSRYFQLAY